MNYLKKIRLQEKRLDKLWSLAIRTRDKFTCQRCGRVHKQVHAAHIVARVFKQTRWDLKNGITMCTYCHLFWAHRQPLEFTRWIENKLTKRKIKMLELKAQVHKDLNLNKIEKQLKNEDNKK